MALDKFKSKTNIEETKKSKRIEVFIKALNSYEDADRIQATLDLGKICDPKTIDPLIQALKDEDPHVQLKAEKALERLRKR